MSDEPVIAAKTPISVEEAPEIKIVFCCRCKHTAGAPLCDGTHKRL
jgi:CDGSH-type Zn-finger protein